MVIAEGLLKRRYTAQKKCEDIVFNIEYSLEFERRRRRERAGQ